FVNATSTTEIYTLSLHDALPILRLRIAQQFQEGLALKVEQPLFADQAALLDVAAADNPGNHRAELEVMRGDEAAVAHVDQLRHEDRKSTRLNSSHVSISYAVFCL